MKLLNNKNVIVTGGDGLLGQAMVKEINAQGGRAIIADINGTTDLSKNRIQLDITDEASIKSLFATSLAQKITIHGWVNNAYPRTSDWGNKFEDISFPSWQKNVDLQLNSYFLCAQYVLQYMRTEGVKGSLINLGSIYGSVGPDFSIYDGTEMTMPAGYAAIKGGIANLGRYLASYYGPHGIRVNTVSPGGIFNHQAADFVAAYERKTPLGRMGKPEDIAPAIAFLLSDKASYITGQNLLIDGGWTAI